MAAENEDEEDGKEGEAWAREMVRGLPPMERDAVEALECIRDWLGGAEFSRLRSV